MLSPATFAQFALTPHRARARRHHTAADGADVLIRRAAPKDEPQIAQLAALEERPELAGVERLVGELGGRVVAAIEVSSGRSVSDPFMPTSGVLELLGLRAAQVRR